LEEVYYLIERAIDLENAMLQLDHLSGEVIDAVDVELGY
jgi:hypothetical protein